MSTNAFKPTKEMLKSRIDALEIIREKWIGNPDYIKTLDTDLYALRLAMNIPSKDELREIIMNTDGGMKEVVLAIIARIEGE